MSQPVIIDDGCSVTIHTRIKDLCKSARNRLGLTNQEISNQISERFGIDDFSVNTINNFFSERSKATTIYTTGYICAVLGISIDAIFGIEHYDSASENTELLRQLAEVNVTLRLKEQEIHNLNERLDEKDERLKQAHLALEHYRNEASLNIKKVQPWVFNTILVLFIIAVLFIIIYLLIFDINNPAYGIFRQTLP